MVDSCAGRGAELLIHSLRWMKPAPIAENTNPVKTVFLQKAFQFFNIIFCFARKPAIRVVRKQMPGTFSRIWWMSSLISSRVILRPMALSILLAACCKGISKYLQILLWRFMASRISIGNLKDNNGGESIQYPSPCQSIQQTRKLTFFIDVKPVIGELLGNKHNFFHFLPSLQLRPPIPQWFCLHVFHA